MYIIDCKDKSEHCAYWMTKGYCYYDLRDKVNNEYDYEEYMAKNCPKTCGRSCPKNEGKCVKGYERECFRK